MDTNQKYFWLKSRQTLDFQLTPNENFGLDYFPAQNCVFWEGRSTATSKANPAGLAGGR
jgi:hypothetical protein